MAAILSRPQCVKLHDDGDTDNTMTSDLVQTDLYDINISTLMYFHQMFWWGQQYQIEVTFAFNVTASWLLFKFHIF